MYERRLNTFDIFEFLSLEEMDKLMHFLFLTDCNAVHPRKSPVLPYISNVSISSVTDVKSEYCGDILFFAIIERFNRACVSINDKNSIVVFYIKFNRLSKYRVVSY